MNLREYFLSLKKFIVFSTLIYIFSICFGYLWAKFFPDTILQILSILKVLYDQISAWGSLEHFLFILLNNCFLFVLILFLSFFFGLYPFFVLLLNGAILGALVMFLKGALPISLFLMSILPHGVFEIPALIIGCGIGFKIAKKTIDIILGKENGLRKEIFYGIIFFIRVLFPVLVLAALVEVYFVPSILNKLLK